jgi:nucleotide-binding universal stress UspA family protein
MAVDHAVLSGKVLDALEAKAKDVGADLIVMATHGRGGLERLRLGSVAEGLVSRGLAPMLLIHPAPDGEPAVIPESLDRVVVALDDSAFAQSILEPLESLGKAARVSHYTLVHVARERAAGHAGWTPLSAVQARAEERMRPIRERLEGPETQVDVQVVMAAEPSAGILGVAKEAGADLIAMTTHGMTGVRPTLVGSVAAQVLRNWTGLLLLRRPGPVAKPVT